MRASNTVSAAGTYKARGPVHWQRAKLVWPWLPAYTWQRCVRRLQEIRPLHFMIGAAGSIFLSWAYQFLPYILVAYTKPLVVLARSSAPSFGKSEKAAVWVLAVDEPRPEILSAPTL
jgi:hypothetical protein